MIFELPEPPRPLESVARWMFFCFSHHSVQSFYFWNTRPNQSSHVSPHADFRCEHQPTLPTCIRMILCITLLDELGVPIKLPAECIFMRHTVLRSRFVIQFCLDETKRTETSVFGVLVNVWFLRTPIWPNPHSSQPMSLHHRIHSTHCRLSS